MRVLLIIGIALAGLVFCAGCSGQSRAAPAAILGQTPHDPRAFTQGLLIYDGVLFESTGQYGASEIRRVDLATGRVEARRALAERYFGEGLARISHKLYQLTWKSGVVFVYNASTLALIDRFSYDGQGWGLTRWHHLLVMSNGSSELRFIDPRSFTIVRRLRVTDHGQPVTRLNELEAVDGQIWANVWLTDRIVRIDPASGHVLGALDAGALAAAMPGSAGVLNGIAFDAEHDRIYITGKHWPTLFRIARPHAASRAR